jgi:hypothetical protein
MELPYCKICSQKFDSSNKPHILPKCGHSFCTNCLTREIKESTDNSIVCIEDGQVYDHITDVNQFPLNSTMMRLIETLTGNVCPEHGKIFEYYCMTDKVR